MMRSMPMTTLLAGILLCGCAMPHRSAAVRQQFAIAERIPIGSGNVLYVLDGRILERRGSDSTVIPMELRSLGADDIESIEVLKGARARQRFGAAGENGVVVITTRRRD